MMSLRSYAVLACLFPVAAVASHRQVPDVYAAIVRHRVEGTGAAATFDGSTDDFLKDLLIAPESPYSELAAQPTVINSEWWEAMSTTIFPDSADPMSDALSMLRTQMGVTKARPGEEYPVGPEVVAQYRNTYSAAQAIKAGVDPDIFWKARIVNGTKFAEAAGEAVALQILRDQIRRNDPSTYEAKFIRPDVMDRYMRQHNSQGIMDDDRRYLGAVLRGASSSRVPSYSAGGLPSGLPTAYRVARIAAAYSDAQGYASGPTCTAQPFQIPKPGEPFCFAAATDRAVRSWYRRELHWQEVSHAKRDPATPFERLMHWIAPILLLLDGVAFIELAEESIASDLLAEGAIRDEEAALATQRATNVTCRIHE